MLAGQNKNRQDQGGYDEQDKPVAAGGLGIGKPPYDRFEEVGAQLAQVGEGVLIPVGTKLFRHIVALGAKLVRFSYAGDA
jgi:hypothetical protein